MMESLEAALGAVMGLSISLTPVVALLLALRPLLSRRYRAKWAYWAWLAVAARLAVPVPLSLPHAPAVELPAPRAVLYRQEIRAPSTHGPSAGGYFVGAPDAPAVLRSMTARPGAGAGTAAAPVPQPADGYTAVLSLTQLLALLWAAGGTLFLGRQLVLHLRFTRTVRRWREPPGPALQARFGALRAQAGGGRVSLALCPAISSPMAAGLLRPLILLPRTQYSPADLDAVLRHELVHVLRRDLWYKLLLLLVRALHWFNPLVHRMASTALRDLELSCDEAVVAGRDAAFRAQYGGAVLRAVEAGQTGSLTTSFKGSKRALKERLRVIAAPGGRKRGALLLCAVLLVAATAGGIVAFGRPAPARALSAERSGYTLEVPLGVAVEQADTFPEGASVSSLDATLSRAGEVLARIRVLPRSRAVPADAAPYRSPGGIPGWRFERGGSVCYALSMTGDTVLLLDFSTQCQKPLGETERAALLSSVRLGFSEAQSPDENYSLSCYPAGEAGTVWYLWDRRGGGSVLLDTAVVPGKLHLARPLWAPDGSYAVVPGRGDRFALLLPTQSAPALTQYDGLETAPTLFDTLETPMDAFARSDSAAGLDTDYQNADRGDLALQALAFGAGTQTGLSRPFSFAYAFTGQSGAIQSGRADYAPQAQAVQRIAPNPPAFRRACTPDAVHGVPGWSAPLPGDLHVSSAGDRAVDPELTLDGSYRPGAVLLTRGNGDDARAVGLVEYVSLNPRQRGGTEGLLSLRGSVAHYYIPHGDTGRAFRLSLRLDVYDQVFTDKIAAAFLVEDSTAGLPAVRLGDPLWRAELDGYAVSLRPLDGGQPWFVLERDGALLPFLDLCAVAGVESFEEYAFQGSITARPFSNVLGRDGFTLSYGVGAAYRPIDYYALAEAGAPVFLAACNVNAWELDLDGDGTAELLTNYHNMGYTRVFDQVDGRVLEADVCADADRLLDLPPGTAGLRYQEPADWRPGAPMEFLAFSTRQNATLPENTRISLAFSDLTLTLPASDGRNPPAAS